MDFKIECKNVEIDGYDCDYKKVSLNLLSIGTDAFNTTEVAEHVSLENMFESHGEDAIREFIEKNYDWFDENKDS